MLQREVTGSTAAPSDVLPTHCHCCCLFIPSQVVEAYRPHVPLLCRVLRSLIMGGFAPGELGWV